MLLVLALSQRLPSNVLSLPHRSVHVRRRTRQRRDRAAGLITIAAGGGQIVAQCATPLANVMRFSLKSPCQVDCIINALDDVRRHGRTESVVVHGVTPSRVLHPGCDGARWLIRPLWLSAAAQDVDPIAAAAFDRYVGDTPPAHAETGHHPDGGSRAWVRWSDAGNPRTITASRFAATSGATRSIQLT